MLHPSYTELIKVVNSEVEDGDTPVVNSRYSIVLATAKRARQIIDGKEPMSLPKIHKPLSIAVDELNKGLLKIMPESAEEEAEAAEINLTDELQVEPGVLETLADETAEEVEESEKTAGLEDEIWRMAEK